MSFQDTIDCSAVVTCSDGCIDVSSARREFSLKSGLKMAISPSYPHFQPPVKT